MSDRFSDVNDFVPTWDCRFKGKGDDRVALTPKKESYIIGHFISSRDAKIKDNDYVIHKFRVIECGDHAHLSEDFEEGKEYEMFGTFVLNATLADPNKVKPGDCILVKWMGKVDPKTTTGRNKPYDSWKVFQDDETPNITIKEGVIVADGASSSEDILDETPPAAAPAADATPPAEAAPAAEPAPVAAAAVPPAEEEGDDDLPF